MAKVDPEHIVNLKTTIAGFPQSPGVYLMKNEVDKIIYVGKAKSIRARVRSYFSGDQTPKTTLLVQNIRKIEFIITKSEVEAFLLEASLIKKHRPKYNVRLKDDKAYPYIRLSAQDTFPRLYMVRKVKKDGGMYFGPFTSGLAVWETIRFLNRTFQIRDCNDHFFRNRTRPCLTHQIGNCTAPCVDLVSPKVYAEDIKGALLFLRGRNNQLLKELQRRMKDAAKEEKFELAAKFRDSLDALNAILEKQAVIDAMGEKDQDIFGFDGDERGTTIEVLHIRHGRLLGSQPHFVPLLDARSPDENPQEWIPSFINQYYEENIVPDEVLLPLDLGNDISKLLSSVLKERSQKEVTVRFPTDVKGQELLDLANRNASQHFKNYVTKSEQKNKGLEDIQVKLGLARLPRRIECFDISNFQGSETVASQVVFEDGVPNKDHYRRYKMKTVSGTDDFASMKEVLLRRLKHEDEEPDLIIVDGGKGQLGVAVEVLKDLGKSHIPVAGLAKARALGSALSKDTKETEERIFLPGRQNPVTFTRNAEALHILVGIRDEAHRFAITYHRKLRESKGLESELDAITGLGEKRKRALLKKFGSPESLRAATVDEIASLQGFNNVLAERILLHLKESLEPEAENNSESETK